MATRKTAWIAAVVMMGLMVSTANAASVSAAIGSVYVDATTPIIFEDNDFGLLVDNGDGVIGAGDFIMGVLQIQQIFAALPTVPPGSIKVGAIIDPPGSVTIGSGTGFNELTAVFGGVLTAPVIDGDNPANHVYGLAPVASLPFPFAFGGTYSFMGGTGTMIDMFEDPLNDFTSAIATAVTSASGGSYLGSFGFTAAAPAPATGANAAGEYWIVIDTSAGFDGALVPDEFEINLSLMAGVPAASPFALVIPNDVDGPGFVAAFGFGISSPGSPLSFGMGGNIFGVGDFLAPSAGWSFNSDGDFKMLLVPVPAAVGPAMALAGLLGLGGLVRKLRTKAAA